MNIGVTEISPREVQRVAEKKFKDGYYCCEALVSAIIDEFKLDRHFQIFYQVAAKND